MLKKNCLLRGSKGRAQRKGAPVPFMYTLSLVKKNTFIDFAAKYSNNYMAF